MRAVAALIATAIAGIDGTDALAGEAGGQGPRAQVSLARHHTTNALEAPHALRDWYTELRGSLEDALTHDLGTTRVAAGMNYRRFDRQRIEDDVALAALAETTARPSETVELRGTLSLNLSDEGDDLAIGNRIVGTRLGQATLTAAGQAGIRLAPDTALVVEALASRDAAGLTRFGHRDLPSLKLEPDRTRLGLGAKLMREAGTLGYGADVAAQWRRSEPAGVYAQITVAEYTARLLGTLKLPGGATIGAAAGVQMLHLAGASFRQVLPTYEFAAHLPLPAGFSLTGSLKGAYDTKTRDDPVAARHRRAELEAGYRASPTVRLGAGVFAEERDNLALGSGTAARGVYGQAVWQPWTDTEITFRIDATRQTQSAPDLKWRAVDAQVAISRRL